jgi:tetratricopeptide (TPR) repeat protein
MLVFLKKLKSRYGKQVIISIGLILYLGVVSAQTNKKLPYLYIEKLQKADEYYSLMNYKQAIDLYQSVLEKSGEDTAIIYKIANSYRLLNDNKNAEEWYRRGIINNENTVNPIHKLNFAQVLTINGKYEEALYWFKEYYKTSSISDLRAKEAIRSIENISSFYYDTTFYVTYPVNINTLYSEFGPCYYKDGIIFLSDRNSAQSGFLSWFFSSVDSVGNFSKPVKFNKSLKTGYNEGPVTFYDDYKKMIFSQNLVPEKFDKKQINDIPVQLFSAFLDADDQWQDKQILPFINKGYSYAQPSVSDDGETLYFSSNMPGGYGGADLYASKFENGTWSSPVNLGNKINTPGNEMFPFIFKDTILYFSSNGHGGLGGLDIFKINLKDTDKLTNLGVPMNSPNDDFGIVLDKDGLSGYLASNRPNGIGSDDIYGFKIVRLTLTIKIIDGATALPVSNAEIYTVDSINGKRIGITDQEGSCTLIVPVCKLYQIRIKRENYETKVYTFESLKQAQKTLAVISLKTKSAPKEENIILTDENNKTIDNPKNVIYKVQICASRVPASTKELKQKYKGDLQIYNFYEDQWYKYAIGEYATYTEAKACLFSCNVYDAFIIAYINNKKVHITIAKANTKETNVQSPINRTDLLNR